MPGRAPIRESTLQQRRVLEHSAVVRRSRPPVLGHVLARHVACNNTPRSFLTMLVPSFLRNVSCYLVAWRAIFSP